MINILPDRPKAEEYLKHVIRVIILKNFKEQEVLKCDGYLPVYKKLSSGRCFNDIVPEDSNKPYDMKKIITSIVDFGDFFEVQPYFAKNIVSGGRRKQKMLMLWNRQFWMGSLANMVFVLMICQKKEIFAI